MRILTVSDIHFPESLWNRDKEYVQTHFSQKKNSISNLTNFIDKQKIELILIAGDVMGDNGSGYSGVFNWLLDYFEENKIYCFFITGNHDIESSYNEIVKSIVDYKYVKEISGQLIHHKDIKILGLSYFQTETLTKLKPFLLQNHTIDILLCHSQNKKIPFLFDFNTRYIITGHFEMIFGDAANKILIAINFGYAAIIDTNKESDTIEYFKPTEPNNFFHSFYKPLLGKVNKDKINIPVLYNDNYINDLRALFFIKKEYSFLGKISTEMKKVYMERKGLRKISKSTQIHYLGKAVVDNIKVT